MRSENTILLFGADHAFGNQQNSFEPGDPEYAIAFADALRSAPTGIKTIGLHSTAAVIDRYRKSAHFMKLKPRTQSDYEKYLTAFEAEFGEDPVKMFEEKASISEIRVWKQKWKHSPKQYDYATSVVTRLLNWTKKEDASIDMHHHVGVERLYKSDRADIIWLPEEVHALLAVANEREAKNRDRRIRRRDGPARPWYSEARTCSAHTEGTTPFLQAHKIDKAGQRSSYTCAWSPHRHDAE